MRTGIALGSNLGDRMANLRAARNLLAGISKGPVLSAPVYQTSPVGCPEGSPDFLNTVIEIDFDGEPLDLLSLTQGFQKQLGRVDSAIRNAPRVIDIDILYLGDRVFANDALEIPHPRLTLRRFVLQPLATMRPDFLLPGDRRTIAAHLEALTDDEILPVITRDW
jgi:2-amino-4-hydroxy-6-hydroxymethyldihydropteridine diphosphokinase